MKYINVILIIIALLSNRTMFNAENTITLTNDEKITTEQKEKTPELNDIQQWNNHLELLTIKGEYWDTADNVPNDKWQSDAFDIAEKIIKKDKSTAETLKTSFFDAIKTKIALEKGDFTKETTNLISEFDKTIENLLKPVEAIKEPEIVSTPTMPEIVITPVIAQEPISEPAPVTTETPTAPQEEIVATQPAQQAQPKDLKSEWKAVLESIKQDESVTSSINKAYDLTTELLLSGQGNPLELEKEFNAALNTRIDQKKLSPLAQDILNRQRAYFNMNIAEQLQSPAAQPSYPMLPPSGMPMSIEQQRALEEQQKQALEKLQAEYAQIDTHLKEEREKQRKKEEQERIVLAAAAKAEQEGALAKEQLQQIHYSARLKKEREEEFEKKRREELEEIRKAREELTKNIEQMAQAQKAAAEKGLFSTFTEAVSNWWYGPSAAKPAELTAKDQEEFLEALVQKTAKEKFKDFQQTLLNFNAPQFWDIQKEMPNDTWIQRMQILMKYIVIKHELISLDELAEIVENVIRTRVRNYPKIIAAIKKPTLEEQAKEKQVMLAKQDRTDRRRERKEQIMLAQQRIKEEEARKQAEENKKKENIMRYKSEKDGWYDLLYKVASNKKATHEDNNEHTQQALKKSQSLLHLAGEIPTKNKSALSQKLKQKFTVALLEQQKRNRHDLNIYHNMDIFNGGVNKMVD